MSKHSFILSPRNRTFSIYFGKNDNWPRWATWVNKCDTSPYVLPRFSSENRKHSKYFQQKCGYGIAEKATGLEFMTHHSLYFTGRWINRWEREREELVLVVTQNQEISAFILNPAMTLGLPLDPQSDGEPWKCEFYALTTLLSRRKNSGTWPSSHTCLPSVPRMHLIGET